MRISLWFKELIRHIGYDVVFYRPVYETTIKPLGITTIIDIGANMGQYAKRARKIFPRARIYSFEPLKDCFEALQKNMSGDTNFTAVHLALGDTTGSLSMERSSFHPSSSFRSMLALHKRLYPKSQGMERETVQIARLDEYAKMLALDGGLLVKIDVQGFEDEVIRGGRQTIRSAKAVIVEASYVSLYADQPLFEDVLWLMKDLGFAYYGSIERHYSKETKKLLFEDALFLKREDIEQSL